ncbi:MAG: hypothetical protein ACRCXT_24190 [Paraclostridium sp.]
MEEIKTDLEKFIELITELKEKNPSAFKNIKNIIETVASIDKIESQENLTKVLKGITNGYSK